MACYLLKGRRAEPTVVVDPSIDFPPKHFGQVLDRFIALQLKPPTPDGLPYFLLCCTTHRRSEAHEESIVSILRSPGPKRIPEEIELDVLVLSLPMNVLTVAHFGLFGMKLQTATFQALRQHLLHELRLLQTAAMDKPVIRVPAKWKLGEVSFHPPIERIVEE